MTKTVKRWVTRIQKFVDRPWYVVLVAFLAAADLFVAFIPTEALLISAVLAKPKRWLSTSLIVTSGSAIGALVLGALLQWDSEIIRQDWLPILFQTTQWQDTAQFVQENGSEALAIIALSPVPQQPGVIIAGLADMPLFQIFIAVWIGRVIKYAAFAWLAASAPKMLYRVWGLKKQLKELS